MKFSLFFTTLLGAASSTSLQFHTPRATNVTLNQVLGALESAKSCDDCQSMLKLIQDVANDGDQAYADLAIGFCKALKEATDDVCEGLLQLEAPSMAYSLRNMAIPSRTSELWCASVYGLCPVPAVQNYTMQFPKRKPCRVARPKPSGAPRKPLKIAHVSDLHVDGNYTVGASTDCGRSICCYPYTPQMAPGNSTTPAGPWGDHACDSPTDLSLSLYGAIAKLSPDFTLFTGDLVEGREWLTTHAEITSDIGALHANMVSAGLGKVYGAVGNHEASPVNSFPLKGQAVPASEDNQYLYDALSQMWSGDIGAAAANSAAYSVHHAPSLRIISINTMFYMVENWWLYTPTMSPDPNDQFAWLVSELQAAEDAHERAYIIGHVPFGRPSAHHDYSAAFDQIVHRYEATVSALFFGHTHRDQWEVSYRDNADKTRETASAIHYVAPALTPTSGNPTFRVYDVDPETWAVLDYTTYIADMAAPSYQVTGPVWEKLYSVKEAYGSRLSPAYTDPSAELTPAFWHDVSVLFEEDDAVFREYWSRRVRGFNVAACDAACKASEICQMRSSQSQFACETPGPVGLRKRGMEYAVRGRSDPGQCRGSTARGVVAMFAERLDLLAKVAREVKAGRRV